MKSAIAIVLLIALASGASGLFADRLLSPRGKHGKEGDKKCPSHPLPAAAPSHVLSALQPFLETAAEDISAALEADNSPGGVALNVVYNDTILWSQGFGLINESDPNRGAPDGNIGFRIGSITKVFTSLMMLMLRDNGTLHSIDQDITDYLPAFKIKNPFQTKRGVTFRQLSSHMSGLPRNPPCLGLFDTGCNLTDDEIYDNLADMELMFPPGEQPAYSNLGFGLLGRVLEQIKGPTWEKAIEEMVFGPLGLNNSGNSFTAESIKHLAVGYYPDGTVADLIDIGWDAPAGQMYASANDLSKLMMLLFRPQSSYNPDKQQVLDGETIREWMQPAYVYADGSGFGYPWELISLGNYTLRTKDGVMNGYNSEFRMAHEIKTGFVFLHSCDGCGSHSKITAIADSIILEVNKILLQMQPGPSAPPNPSEYVGTYATDTGTINVSLVDYSGYKFLTADELGYRVVLEWSGGNAFQASIQGFPVPCYILGSGHIGERTYFQRGNDSTIVSLTLPGLSYGTTYIKKT